MDDFDKNLIEINKLIKDACQFWNRDPTTTSLLAVTKNQTADAIYTLLKNQQRLFGENRVQEALIKWPELKKNYPDIELHLIGHLQTNKVKDAVALFDVIETLDSFKLADKLAKEEERQQKKLAYYIEINIGEESQKTGILPANFENFLVTLRNNYPLNIKGIMCIPPSDQNATPYFQRMQQIAKEFQLDVISMGMSDDFEIAIKYGSNLVRIGRALFRKN